MKHLVWLILSVFMALNLACSEAYKPYGIPERSSKVSESEKTPAPKKPEPPAPIPVPWKNLIGEYRLVRMDGELIAPAFWREIYMEKAPSYVDPNTDLPVQMMMIPLFKEVTFSGSADLVYFGVIENLGTSKIEFMNGNDIYTYKFNGYLKTPQGQPFLVNFDIEIEQDRAMLMIKYSLEWAGQKHIHSFELIRELN